MDPAPIQTPAGPAGHHALWEGPGRFEKALDSCKRAVNNQIPGSLKENASFEDKAIKIATIGTIGVVFITGMVTGGAVPLFAITLGSVMYKAFEHSQQTHTTIAIPSRPDSHINDYKTKQINDWLFDGKADNDFPKSVLAEKQSGRNQEKYAPKVDFSQVPMLSQKGKYMSRIAVYNGGITDIKFSENHKVAIGDSNNGDLLTGCGAAVATAIINAAGPDLQKDLYNKFDAPEVMRTPEFGSSNYSNTEGRGYSLTCDAHDMKDTHNIERVEFMTVPFNDTPKAIEGVHNMYREAFENSKDLDFIVLPMAGVTHPVLKDKPELSAEIATEEFKEFVKIHPESKLKVIFAIFDAKDAVIYANAAEKL